VLVFVRALLLRLSPRSSTSLIPDVGPVAFDGGTFDNENGVGDDHESAVNLAKRRIALDCRPFGFALFYPTRRLAGPAKSVRTTSAPSPLGSFFSSLDFPGLGGLGAGLWMFPVDRDPICAGI